MSYLKPRNKGKAPAQQSKRSRQEEASKHQTDFESRHFPDSRLAKHFCKSFMTRMVLPTFYLLPDWLRSLSISNRNFLELLEEVGWINALFLNENIYPDLVRVFYSNMDTSAEKENRVITNVGGVLIEFDDTELNEILRSSVSGDSLEIYSARKAPEIDIMNMLRLFITFVGVLILLMKFVLFTSELSVYVFNLGFYFILFKPLFFLGRGT